MALLTAMRGELMRTLMSVQPYKPGQGAYARYGTLVGAGVIIVSGMWTWLQASSASQPGVAYAAPVVVGGLVAWIVYRMVHYPPFAEFLINTQAEMTKVVWPSQGEVKASTAVVLASVVLMMVFLFVVDRFWVFLLSSIGVLRIQKILGAGGTNMTNWLWDILAWAGQIVFLA